MIDTKWRYSIQPLFDILAKRLILLRLKPNHITWIAFGVGVSASVLVGTGKIFLSIILLWLSGLLDVLDGTVARLTDSTSKGGAYMDLILDRMVESLYILGFAYRFPQGYYAYLLFYIAVIFNFTTFIVAGALFQNNSSKSMHYDVGIAERTETFLVFTLITLLPIHIISILLIFDGLIFITGIIRFIRVLVYCSSFQKKS